MSPHSALAIGNRTVLAMTCIGPKCHGQLHAGTNFERYRRSARDKVDYIDRRCKGCRWKHLDRMGGNTRL